MDSSLKISRAGFSDLETILEIQKKAFISEAEIYDRYDIEPLNQTIESAKAEFDLCVVLKVEINNRIVGSVRGRNEGDICWVTRLIVAPEYQNRGIGKKLLTAIEAEFPETSQYHLFTGHKSTRNIKFYESAGYKIINIFKDENQGGFKFARMVKNNKKEVKKC